ncbi:hypothetical protein [Arthrobacter sp. UYCu512]
MLLVTAVTSAQNLVFMGEAFKACSHQRKLAKAAGGSRSASMHRRRPR